MRQIWIISDTHFGHEKIIDYAGRPFSNAIEMDEAICDNWNDRVKPDDLVYHLGDVAWRLDGVQRFAALPGTKRLCLGNHDDAKLLIGAVQQIYLFKKLPEFGLVLSHIPLDMWAERFDGMINVHGHIHEKPAPSPRHFNACVEHIGYGPTPIEEVK